MTVFGNRIDVKFFLGDPDRFSLEERVFNTFCLIAVIAMAVEVPFNFFIGLTSTALICLFSVFYSTFLYYLSRIKHKFNIAMYLFAIVANAVFAVNYFYNSGINGPNFMLFSIALLLTVVIIPKNQYKYWLTLNLLMVFALLFYEYNNPSEIKISYNDQISKFIDYAMTYLVTALLVFLSISFVRGNYDEEKKRVEKQNLHILEQKLALEKTNSEKDKLFSIVSHDIRVPLNSIQGYLELLTEINLSDAERVNIKQRLLQVTRDTTDIITNVLVWSKSQLDGSYIDLIAINVEEFLKESLNVERNISLKKGVELHIECEKDIVVTADKNMLQIVLRNLVNNAIKFTHQSGTIKVTAQNENNNCIIKVVDNGLGVPENLKSHLFELKAGSTYGTNNEKGVGLGLLLCKEFAELQGGKIWYEEANIKGATFVLSLPKTS